MQSRSPIPKSEGPGAPSIGVFIHTGVVKAHQDTTKVPPGCNAVLRRMGRGALVLAAVAIGLGLATPAGAQRPALRAKRPSEAVTVPPLVRQARRFLAERGPTADRRLAGPANRDGSRGPVRWRRPVPSLPHSAASGAWQPVGPAAVVSPSFGLVTGRISALALDPSDGTGNTLYAGATGGGVWKSQNAGTGNTASVAFTPLTDGLAAFAGVADVSLSIGALTVQPGGTGVILAGTGDPNDALDSYYGAGILRSTDGGNTWSLIVESSALSGMQPSTYTFAGEGFAGFAWSTVNPQLVVAAVSQAYEATLVNTETPGVSYEGLYYSQDGGATWLLATITDGGGNDVQGPNDQFALPDGNAATSVVWNPVRQLFIAAVRFHGYYQSPDGITWTRMAAQPGAGLAAANCPTNQGSTGSIACPIFRGTLAVNPLTGDTFAWTVDENNQDQGLWQDQCVIAGGGCTEQTIQFGKQWSTAALEVNTIEGPATIQNGDYNLALAAVPSQQDTILLAGDNDLWKCSIYSSCVWRNTTNVNTCMSAKVGGYQHALAWNAANPLDVYIGNDSGLWRSTDAIGETGAVCSASDSSHFQNLNGSLGSLAEVVGMATSSATPYQIMLGLGVNGTAGVKSASPVADWPTLLGGEGGPVAIDPVNNTSWYANNEAGVSIHECSQSAPCTPAAFGLTPQVTDADVNGDGLTMTAPAPFLIDPLERTDLVIGTCRVWRGPASGVGWSSANAISPIFDANPGVTACNGDALIRSLAALPVSASSEAIYAGMYGSLNGGAPLGGHIFGAVLNPSSATAPVWTDLTENPVTNDSEPMNASAVDISSIFIDPHDPTGKTVYVTIEGNSLVSARASVVYGSTDGGAHWLNLSANLLPAPASSLVIDPQDANTAYIATDSGVYSTRQIATCGNAGSICWSPFGTGLPQAPVVTLTALPATAALQVLVAGTYGRGAWQVPLWTAGVTLTTATASPASLKFASQVLGTVSAAQTVTLTNTGAVALTPAISTSGDFNETDNCPASLNEGRSCAIQVTYAPSVTGAETGALTIAANIAGGQIVVPLTGTGITAGAVSLLPSALKFGLVAIGTVSPAYEVTAANTGQATVSVSSVSVGTGPFAITSNTCGSQIAGGSQCQLKLVFAPTAAQAYTGTLTMIDSAGTQMTQLSGTGAALATDTLSASSLAFPPTVPKQLSAQQNVTITNSGDLSLPIKSIAINGHFTISQNNCGGLLTGHNTCAIGVEFAPAFLGPVSGTLTITDALRVQTVTLTGTGVAPGLLSVSPARLTFPVLAVGLTSPPQTLTITNKGGSAVANLGFQFTGAAAASFSYSASTCGALLAPAGQCTVQIAFTPASTGGSAASLVISSSSVGVAQVTVPLNGSGTANGITVNPTALTFATLAIGQQSAPQTVSITNASGIALASLTATASAQFGTTNNTCPATLAAGAQCSVGVVFLPTAQGPVTGALTLSSPSFATPATVSLSGAGAVAPAIVLSPQVLNFAETGVGQASPTQQVTLTNPGTLTALTGLAFTVKGSYVLASNGCTATLAPGASCSLSVGFAPTAAGSQSGNLTVAATGVASGFVTLSGRGFDFTFVPQGAGSQTVADSQTASYVLNLTTLGGSSGSFTFECGALPPNTQCAFSPATVGVTGGASNTVTAMIATGVSASAAQDRGLAGLIPSGSKAPRAPLRWPAVPLVCGLLAPFTRRRRRGALLVSGLILMGAVCLSSCLGASGGGGTRTGGSGVTPPGTYSIPVTAMSNNVKHTVTLMLTVD